MGAGWYEREHQEYGFPYPDNRTRLEILEEQLEVVHGQMRDETFDFEGKHYRLRGLRAHPAPVQRPRPPLILGGTAGPRSVALAARFADEYNTIHVGPEECRTRRSRLAEACERAGRDPSSLRFSLMTACIVGRDRDDLAERVRRAGGDDPDAFAESHPGWLVGTAARVVDQLGELAQAGVDRVMLQHHAHEDLDMVAVIGDEIVPAV
jgi:alkanesulfonate monooxygenase SsuD/methylene tetrahydromethanopterin reductase-like flavin-dependent oxidoreductase (luciferase family)